MPEYITCYLYARRRDGTDGGQWTLSLIERTHYEAAQRREFSQCEGYEVGPLTTVRVPTMEEGETDDA